MKISELLEENNESPFERFGIVVDKLSSDIVKNITKIGIIATPEEKMKADFHRLVLMSWIPLSLTCPQVLM